jgi:hypothetical protein
MARLTTALAERSSARARSSSAAPSASGRTAEIFIAVSIGWLPYGKRVLTPSRILITANPV